MLVFILGLAPGKVFFDNETKQLQAWIEHIQRNPGTEI